MNSPKELAEELLRLREVAAPGPWHHDAGNWEIETHDESNYRQAICSVAPDNRKTCEGECNEWSQDLETPDFIVFAANHAKEIAQALLDAVNQPQISIEAAVAGYHEIVLNQDKQIEQLKAEIERLKSDAKIYEEAYGNPPHKPSNYTLGIANSELRMENRKLKAEIERLTKSRDEVKS